MELNLVSHASPIDFPKVKRDPANEMNLMEGCYL